MNNSKDIECKYGQELARPYINRQIYTNSYAPSIALKKEHYFLSYIWLNQIIIMIGYMKIL